MCPRTSAAVTSTSSASPGAGRSVAAAIAAVLASSGTLAGETAGTEQALDPVVVTARRLESGLEVERALTPGAVTVLDSEDLQQRSVTQLADLLRYVPGVWAESYNGNDEVFYSSRGSNLDATDYDKNGIKFLQDGLPVTTADGNNHNRALDPMNARYVTVAHGANALAYGASTLGGAIDFATPTARNSPPMAVAVSGGSFGQWGARTTVGGVSGALDGQLAVETQQRDGYREHSSQDRRNLYGNFGWEAGENVSTRFYGTWSDYHVQLPRELTPAQYHADPRQARADALSGDHSKSVEAWRLAFKTTVVQVAGGTLELGASHERQSLFHPIVSGQFFSLLIDTDHEHSGAMLRWRRAARSHDVVLGANYGLSKVTGGNFENDGGERGALMETIDDDASTLELFALDRWNLAPRWTLVYGGQFVQARRDADGFRAPAYNAFNPRLGVIFALDPGAEWYASVGRAYEAPTLFQLRDDTAGAGTPVALEPMSGVAIESGLRGTGSAGTTRLAWELSGYYIALRDEILSRDVAGTSLATNVDTRHAGIESLLSASFTLGHAHRIEPLLSATFNAFTFDSDTEYGNNRLPSAPRWFARGELMYAHASGFRAGPTFDFAGGRYVDFSNSYRVGSYGLLGARASFGTDNWEIYAEGRNLLDRQYVAAVVVKDQADPSTQMLHPGAPRAVYFGARYQF